MVRVLAPTSKMRPSASCFITTRLASHARRWDVSAENARDVLDDGLAGLIGILEDDGVDRDHHPVVLGRRARIDVVMERGLGQELQRVGLLSHRRRFRGIVFQLSAHIRSALALM
jgi:hypothetical protein